MRRAAIIGAVLAVSCLATGCGGASVQARPRRVLGRELSELARGKVRAVCRGLTSGATGQLRTEFGGAGCTATVNNTVRYMTSTPGERRSVATAKILVPVDLPLSPAPYYTGESEVRIRVSFWDPVIDERQLVDLRLRIRHGVWRVSSGLAAMFTLL